MTLREQLERIAKDEGLLINPYQERQIHEMEATGRCHCTPDRSCPCEERKEDLKRWGACLCRLLVTEKYLKNYEKGLKYREKKASSSEEPLEQGEPSDQEGQDGATGDGSG